MKDLVRQGAAINARNSVTKSTCQVKLDYSAAVSTTEIANLKYSRRPSKRATDLKLKIPSKIMG